MNEQTKRVIFTMGGKGGVGKTSVMTAVTDWFDSTSTLYTLLDLDVENKSVGSLSYFYKSAIKENIFTENALDVFLDHLDKGVSPILADMGASSGAVAYRWFEDMYAAAAANGVKFTAIGVITEDPASAESVLEWARQLRDRVDYVIVENQTIVDGNPSAWQQNKAAPEFLAKNPVILKMGYRLPNLETISRKHGATLSKIADRNVPAAQLSTAVVLRAAKERNQFFQQLNKHTELFF